MNGDELNKKLAAMTCDGCEMGYPLKKGWHDTWDDGSIHFLCTSLATELRALIDEQVAAVRAEALEEVMKKADTHLKKVGVGGLVRGPLQDALRAAKGAGNVKSE